MGIESFMDSPYESLLYWLSPITPRVQAMLLSDPVGNSFRSSGRLSVHPRNSQLKSERNLANFRRKKMRSFQIHVIKMLFLFILIELGDPTQYSNLWSKLVLIGEVPDSGLVWALNLVTSILMLVEFCLSRLAVFFSVLVHLLQSASWL